MNIYKDRSSSEETRVDTNDPANASSRLDLCKQIDPPPVFRLYPDLCSDIFIECLSSNSWRNKDQYMSPLALSHVCSSWRNIAWTTPRLWNAIQLDLNGIRREHVVLVVEWLLQSGALPLSIFAYADLREPSSAALAVLDIISLHAERWSRVAFDFPRHYYYPLYKAEGRLHTIQYLELPLDSGARNVNMDIFSVAPRLHHVCLRVSDDYDYDIVQTFVLPLDQLTKLSVECDLEKCIRILQLCPQVIECTFYSELPWCTVTTPLLYTGRLESLRLCAFRTQLSFYFGHLTMPDIRNLSCSSLTVQSVFPHLSFISFISRSSCSLQSLSIDGFAFNGGSDFLQTLLAVPSLQGLSITQTDIFDHQKSRARCDIFSFFDPSHPLNLAISGALLPNLKAFQYKGRWNPDFSILKNFLRLGWEREVPVNDFRLESIQISTSISGIPEPSFLSWLQGLTRQGMSITLVTADGRWP